MAVFRLPVLIVLIFMIFAHQTVPALALQTKQCEAVSLSKENLQKWYNPQPSPSDFEIPIPGGMTLVFNRVPLGAQGLYGDEKSVYTMGSSTRRVFETNLNVRVGSTIADRDRQSQLLIGKYELSKAQFSAVMGRGHLLRGVNVLLQKSRDPRVKKELGNYLDKSHPCYNKITKKILLFLAEPLTFLSYRDYIDFLDAVNLYCISRNSCGRILAGLGPNPDYPGFLRLPLEHEWEFVARGGGKYVEGKLPRSSLQSDVPSIASGKTILDYAHIEDTPARPLPIGSREPLFGFYDMLGNAQELMQNPFTAENGFGAVGGYVGRGGHYRSPRSEIRVSQRTELTVFRRDDITRKFDIQYFPYTGVRLALGLPVVGATERTGSTQLAADFTQNYTQVDEAGDIAGNTLANAKDLGTLTKVASSVSDELASDDKLDFYKFRLNTLSSVEFKIAEDNEFVLELVDDSQKVFLTATTPRKGVPKPISTQPLLPGEYYVKLAPVKSSKRDQKYKLVIAAVPVPDTGIERPSTQALLNPFILKHNRYMKQRGYVGRGDRVDTFPIRDSSSIGGIRIEVSGFAGNVTAAYLNDRMQVVRSIEANSSSSPLELPVSSKLNQAGFVQISTSGSNSTLYELKVRASRPYDAVFLKEYKRSVGEFADVGKEYKGYLDRLVQRLLLPIRLDDARSLRLELTGLSSNVDLRVLDENGSTVDSDHVRNGTSPEIFIKDVEAGKYYAQVTLKSRDAASRFQVVYSISETKGVRVVDPAIARERAGDLGSVSSYGTSVNKNSTDTTSYFKFQVTDPKALVTVDLTGFIASADLDLFLENSTGSVIAKSSNSGSAPETIEEVLAYGDYYLRVHKSGTSKYAYYTVGLSGSTGMRDRNYKFGDFQEAHGDYKVYKEGKTCWMVTKPVRVSPQIGWRKYAPIFYVGVERRDRQVHFIIDVADEDGGADVFRGGSVRAVVVGSGRNRKVPVQFQGRHLKPLERCNNSSDGWCISSNAVRRFRRGQELHLQGTNPKNGETVQIVYSLRGYTKSAQRINKICGGRANWVWNK